MPHSDSSLSNSQNPLPISVVGSIGSLEALKETSLEQTRGCCEVVEIRLDLIAVEGAVDPSWWAHLFDFPLLFTARRVEEGGSGNFTAAHRTSLLQSCLADAALVDVELASVKEMKGFLEELNSHGIPWLASSHDFQKLPSTSFIVDSAQRAFDAGAAAFKVAAQLHTPADIARLADFQLATHPLPVASMGMGKYAHISRLLCAQSGSILNYGFLGNIPTAPGQWSARQLKDCIPSYNRPPSNHPESSNFLRDSPWFFTARKPPTT